MYPPNDTTFLYERIGMQGGMQGDKYQDYWQMSVSW